MPVDSTLSADVERMLLFMEAIAQRRSLRDPIAALCESAQLTPPQVHTLLWLGRGPLPMNELARMLSVTVKTVTGVVDRLELQGLCKRARSESDRRVVRAGLTAKGQKLSLRMQQSVREGVGSILGLLGPTDRQQLFDIFQKLVSRMPAMSPVLETKEKH